MSHAPHRLSLLAFALFALGLSDCAPRPYAPPKANEPHAIVKFRRVYVETAGMRLDEELLIGEERLFAASSEAFKATAPQNDAVRVHPLGAVFAASSTFSHVERRTVQETYYEQVPRLESETYNCGSLGEYRTCTRTVTRYHSEAKQRWVTKNVDIVDSACSSRRGFTPRVGGVYLLELSYQESGSCQLACYEQVALPGGQFQNHPCPAFVPTNVD